MALANRFLFFVISIFAEEFPPCFSQLNSESHNFLFRNSLQDNSVQGL
jgi:hypothetical protein